MKISNISGFIAVIAFSALAGVSCQRENPVSSSSSDLLLFSPSIEDQQACQTKGAMISGSTFDNSKTFFASAWNGATKQFDYTEFKYFTHSSGSKHSYWSAFSGTTPVEYYWSKDQEKTIFAYHNLPASGATVAASSSKQTLSYTVPTTASAQTDIVLAYYKGTGYERVKESGDAYEYVGRFADLTFKHPLAAVVFKKGTFEGWTTNDKITKIAIEGVYKSGDCAANASFTWTPGTETTTVSMEKATGLSISASDIIGETFLLIPQNFASKNVTIKVDFTIGEVAKSASCTVNQWEIVSGKYTTFEIGLSSVNPFSGLTVTHVDWQYEKGADDKDYFDTEFND